MRAALLLFLAALPLALPPLASAQTTNCKSPQTPREKTVCSDTRLQALDAEIAANYEALRMQLSPDSVTAVASDQLEWLRWIDLVCPANGKGAAANQTQCLQNQYFTRANDLTKVTRVGSTVIFPRAQFLYVPGNGSTTNPISPGFGYGSLRWPQVDKPNAAQTAFNNAAQTKAAALAIGYSNAQNATFATAVDASGAIDAYFTVDAANDRLIDVTFTDGAFPWGAAHPTASRTSFLWWLNQSTQLATTDIFNEDSAWRQSIVPLAIASLQSNPNLKDNLSKGTQLQQGVQSAVLEPVNWTPTRDGLTITFAQYSVGPYFIGMPQAHLPWDQLKPYLANGFNPSTLPIPVPKSNP